MRIASLREAFDGLDLLALRVDGQHGAAVDALPSMMTVQAPQVPRSQTRLAPVRSRWLRMASSSVTRGSTVVL